VIRDNVTNETFLQDVLPIGWRCWQPWKMSPAPTDRRSAFVY
jgi:hypothetical protein